MGPLKIALISLALASAAHGQTPQPPQPPLKGWAPFGPGGGTPQGLAIDPRNPAVIYAAEGTLYRSADAGGRSWQRTGNEPWQKRLDAADPDTLYTGSFQAGVLRSRDGGATLKPIGALFDPPRQPIGFLATFRAQPGILYAGASFGVLFAGRF